MITSKKNNCDKYLTFDPCQATCTGLWLAEASAVTPTRLSGESQGVQLPLLLPLYPLHACSLQEGLPLSGGERLQETSVTDVSVTAGSISVSIWDLIYR